MPESTEGARRSCFCGRFEVSGFSSVFDERDHTWHLSYVCTERHSDTIPATPSTELGRAREAVIEVLRQLADANACGILHQASGIWEDASAVLAALDTSTEEAT